MRWGEAGSGSDRVGRSGRAQSWTWSGILSERGQRCQDGRGRKPKQLFFEDGPAISLLSLPFQVEEKGLGPSPCNACGQGPGHLDLVALLTPTTDPGMPPNLSSLRHFNERFRPLDSGMEIGGPAEPGPAATTVLPTPSLSKLGMGAPKGSSLWPWLSYDNDPGRRHGATAGAREPN